MSDFDQIKYQNEYNRQKYDRITIMTPKGKKEEIKAAASAAGMSVNEYIIKAIDSFHACLNNKQKEEIL